MTIHEDMRPKSWSEFYGNEQPLSEFVELVGEAMVHVFLIQGPSGIGKTTIARIAARELEAEVVEMNAADTRGVEDWRTIVASFPMSPLHGRRKAYIIDECQQITAAAWELLLKPMENTPRHLYLFFCTTKVGADFPRTVVDRMRPVLLKAPNLVELGKFAQDKAALMGFKLSKTVKSALVANADGSYRRCISRLDSLKRLATDEERLAYLEDANMAPEEESAELKSLWTIMLNTSDVPSIAEESRKVLSVLQQNKVTPLSIRYATLAYFSAVYLKSGSVSSRDRSVRILHSFGIPWPDTTSYAGVITSIDRIAYG